MPYKVVILLPLKGLWEKKTYCWFARHDFSTSYWNWSFVEKIYFVGTKKKNFFVITRYHIHMMHLIGNIEMKRPSGFPRDFLHMTKLACPSCLPVGQSKRYWSLPLNSMEFMVKSIKDFTLSKWILKPVLL